MQLLKICAPLRLVITAFAVIGSAQGVSRADFVLSDNLSETSGGTEAATGGGWLASSFGAGASDSTLTGATLLLSSPNAGQAVVDLYSDGGLQPGSPLAVLTSSGGSLSGTLTATTFTASGVSLAANSTYWVVLKATSGEVDWSWTASDTGTGTGFQDTWANSADAGASWFAFNSSPTQMTVTADITGVPEPGSIVLFGTGLVGVALGRRYLQGRAGALRSS